VTPERAGQYARFLLSVLLDGTVDRSRLAACDERELLTVARGNKVLLRLQEVLEQEGLDGGPLLTAAVAEERRRAEEWIDFVRKVHRCLSGAGVVLLFPSAFQHYPDIGADLDLFVLSGRDKIHDALTQGLGMEPCRGDFADWVAGRRKFTLAGCPLVLDVHDGRSGLAGEDAWHGGLLFVKRAQCLMDGVAFPVPSPEDQLILQGCDRVYGRRYLRLSDVLWTIKQIRRQLLDEEHLRSTATRLGTVAGLCCYLSYVEQIYREVFGCSLLQGRWGGDPGNGAWGSVEFTEKGYRLRRLPVTAKLYGKKWRRALLTGDWRGAGRLCLVPLVAGVTLLRKGRQP
jgi:hypothetical protein